MTSKIVIDRLTQHSQFFKTLFGLEGHENNKKDFDFYKFCETSLVLKETEIDVQKLIINYFTNCPEKEQSAQIRVPLPFLFEPEDFCNYCEQCELPWTGKFLDGIKVNYLFTLANICNYLDLQVLLFNVLAKIASLSKTNELQFYSILQTFELS